MTVILPYDIINYINKFLPMPVHPTAKIMKEYLIMYNFTVHKNRDDKDYNDVWRTSFYRYLTELRYYLKKEHRQGKKIKYFHMQLDSDYFYNYITKIKKNNSR